MGLFSKREPKPVREPGWYFRHQTRTEQQYWTGEYWTAKRRLDLDGNVLPSTETYHDAHGVLRRVYEPPVNERIVCPHCGERGCVTVEPFKGNAAKRIGATAAFGVLGAVAVKSSGPGSKLHCRECGMDWVVPLES